MPEGKAGVFSTQYTAPRAGQPLPGAVQRGAVRRLVRQGPAKRGVESKCRRRWIRSAGLDRRQARSAGSERRAPGRASRARRRVAPWARRAARGCRVSSPPPLLPTRGYVLYLTYKTVLEGGDTTDVYKASQPARALPSPWGGLETGARASGQASSWWTAPNRPANPKRTPPGQVVEFPLKVSQTAAIMEVVHSMVGLVRSPVGITGEKGAGAPPAQPTAARGVCPSAPRKPSAAVSRPLAGIPGAGRPSPGRGNCWEETLNAAAVLCH